MKPPHKSELDIPTQDMSMVNFSQGILEFLMMAGGTTTLRSGNILGKYHITVGKHRFQGADSVAAYRNMFFWLLTSKLEMTPQEYAERAAEVIKMEDEDMDGVVEILAEGGMTEFGKKVQESRLKRGGELAEALRSITEEKGHMPTDISVLQTELQRRTGYDDIDAAEILVVIGDLQRLKAAFPA